MPATDKESKAYIELEQKHKKLKKQLKALETKNSHTLQRRITELEKTKQELQRTKQTLEALQQRCKYIRDAYTIQLEEQRSFPQNEYVRGMSNGIIFAVACIDDFDPTELYIGDPKSVPFVQFGEQHTTDGVAPIWRAQELLDSTDPEPEPEEDLEEDLEPVADPTEQDPHEHEQSVHTRTEQDKLVSNVYSLGGDLPANQVLYEAMQNELGNVVVVGFRSKQDAQGNKFYCAASYATHESVVYVLQQANLFVLEHCRS